MQRHHAAITQEAGWCQLQHSVSQRAFSVSLGTAYSSVLVGNAVRTSAQHISACLQILWHAEPWAMPQVSKVDLLFQWHWSLSERVVQTL